MDGLGGYGSERKNQGTSGRLNRYSYEYYVLDNPSVSDGNTTAFLRELEGLEKSNIRNTF